MYGGSRYFKTILLCSWINLEFNPITIVVLNNMEIWSSEHLSYSQCLLNLSETFNSLLKHLFNSIKIDKNTFISVMLVIHTH